jgi:capsular exopolysaccharide synthesis family protein
LLNDKLQSEDEAKMLSGLPILGVIPLSKTDEKLVFEQNSQSVISEMIRLLRTNLQYVIPGKSKGAFLITSSTSGEGKTFVAINLALALASTKKRVLILDLDLRRPKLAEYLGCETSLPGISNFLVGRKNLEDVIYKHKENDFLSFIPAGPVPPNPAELLLTEKVNEMITACKEQFDYILLDSPPLGLVADSFLLNKYVDGTLLIARQNHTQKGMLKYIRDNKAQNRLLNPHLIYNGAKKSDHYGYRYGHGYYTN